MTLYATIRGCSPAASWRRWVRAFLACCLLLALAPAARAESESAVKAAYLYHFTSLVKWPASALQDDSALVIGVVGRDPFEGGLTHLLRRKSVSGRRIEVRQVNAGDVRALRECHLLYVPAGERLASAAAAVSGLPVLVVSDEAHAAGKGGGTIGFVTRNQRVKLEINQDTAKRSLLSISSDLLGIATLVKTP